VIDFIDMRERNHDAEVEKTFKKALSIDRARIQLSRISKFGILELSRQKKQSTIQEISYSACPFCKGRGVRPSLEYTALNAFRKIESQAVKGTSSALKITLPYEIADYLLNQKRSEIGKLENVHDMSIHISGDPDTPWDELKIESVPREKVEEIIPEQVETTLEPVVKEDEKAAEPDPVMPILLKTDEQIKKIDKPTDAAPQPAKKKSRRKPRFRKKKPDEKPEDKAVESKTEMSPERAPETRPEPERVKDEKSDPLSRLRRMFEQLVE